jgi:predicted nucleic acid-binding protein
VTGAGEKRPLICDTGALIDYLVATSPDHGMFRKAIDAAGTRYVPGLVLAEVDYFLREERRAMAALLADLERGAFTFAPPTLPLLQRAMAIDLHHADLKLGLVDASLVALAEVLGVTRVATRDVRDFRAVRLHDGRSLELVAPRGAR